MCNPNGLDKIGCMHQETMLNNNYSQFWAGSGLFTFWKYIEKILFTYIYSILIGHQKYLQGIINIDEAIERN